MKKLMIYGATGYTGRMAALHAKQAGLDVVLAGRDEAPLARLAAELGTGYRVFSVDDADLADIGVLLNCAGPFMRN